MKVWIDYDERWPDYSVRENPDSCGREREIPTELLARIRAAEKEYGECQRILRQLHESRFKDEIALADAMTSGN